MARIALIALSGCAVLLHSALATTKLTQLNHEGIGLRAPTGVIISL